MNTWIATTAALLGLIATLITILIGVKKLGNIEQSFKDGIANIEKEVIRDRIETVNIGSKMEQHFLDKTIHRNIELEKRIEGDLKDFQSDVKIKLDKILQK